MDEDQNRQKRFKNKAAIEAQQPPRPAASSMASPTKKLASVAASFIRAVFCSPVKNEQKSIRKLSNPEAAAEAAARTTMSTSSSGENGGHGGEQLELEHVPEMIGISYQVNRRQRCVSEAQASLYFANRNKSSPLSRNQMNTACRGTYCPF